MPTGPWMIQLSSFNQFGAKSEQISQFTVNFHRVKTCFWLLLTPLTLIDLDLIMPKPVYLMTVHEAHKEYNSIIDQIRVKYELLDINTPAFKAESCELAHLMAQMSNLCNHLKLPVPMDLHRPPHFKHWSALNSKLFVCGSFS